MSYTFLVKCKVSYEVSVFQYSLGKSVFRLGNIEVVFFLGVSKITRTFLNVYVYTVWRVFSSVLPSGLVRQDFFFARNQTVVHQRTTRGLDATVFFCNGKIICCCYSILECASKGKLCLFLRFTCLHIAMLLTGV